MDLYPEGPSPHFLVPYSPEAREGGGERRSPWVYGDGKTRCMQRGNRTYLTARGRELNYHGGRRVSIKALAQRHCEEAWPTKQSRCARIFIDTHGYDVCGTVLGTPSGSEGKGRVVVFGACWG